MVPWVDAEYEVVCAGAVVGGGQEDCPAEIVYVGVEEGQSFELRCVRVVGSGRRWVESAVYVADLRRGGGGELKGEEIVEGGLAVAGRGDEEAGLRSGSVRAKGSSGRLCSGYTSSELCAAITCRFCT